MSQPVLNWALVQWKHQDYRHRLTTGFLLFWRPVHGCRNSSCLCSAACYEVGISSVLNSRERGKSDLWGCLSLKGASFLLLMVPAGCPQLLSLEISHRFHTLGEILKSRNGIEPSSPSSSFPGKAGIVLCVCKDLPLFLNSYTVFVALWLKSQCYAVCISYWPLLRFVLSCGVSFVRVPQTLDVLLHLPRPVLGSAAALLRSDGDAPLAFVTCFFPFVEAFRARAHICESAWMFPVVGLYSMCLLCWLFPKRGPETCREQDLVRTWTSSIVTLTDDFREPYLVTPQINLYKSALTLTL